MQMFKSSSTGETYAYDPAVVISIDAAGVSTGSVAGRAIAVPTDLVAYTPEPPSSAQLLAAAQAAQIQQLSDACAAQIISGFVSSALGITHTYPSSPTDQSNLIGVVASGVATAPFWCADPNGNWALVSHTAAQLKQVLIDGATDRVAYSVKLDGLVKQIMACTTPAAVQAVTW
jgi:hypothetical protein